MKNTEEPPIKKITEEELKELNNLIKQIISLELSISTICRSLHNKQFIFAKTLDKILKKQGIPLEKFDCIDDETREIHCKK